MLVAPIVHVFSTLMVLTTRHASATQVTSLMMATTVRTLMSVAQREAK